MKKWALITGASQGIGYEFAGLFAQHGCDLILVARDQPRLAQVADELRSRHSAVVKVLPTDLAAPAAALEIFDELQREQIPVSTLVNNAGFVFQGAFVDLDLQKHL